ncbi:DnaD domain protein [Malacoplasma muris]|uniref:DnaD domain protein n=1 Tax=Malacoplasma muris TaxID=2119 RepID=UPI00398E358F
MSLYTKNTVYNYVNFYNYDFNSLELYKLYMPIISLKSMKLFLHLCSDISTVNFFKFSKKYVSDLLSNLDFSSYDFDISRKNLEAVGLLKTYCSKNKSELIFDIIPPLNFSRFCSNQKLRNLLIDKIGNKEFEFLEILFSKNEIPNYYDDISSDIDEYYENNFDGIYEFNFDALYENLAKTTSISLIIDEDIKKLINKYYTDKKFTFEQIESFIYKSIVMDNSNNNFVISYNVLVKNLEDNSKDRIKQDFNKVIEINRHNDLFMENTSLSSLNKAYKDYSSFDSEQYLFLITNTELNADEIETINLLRKEYRLNDMLINMMIDYSLDKTHHVLNAKYLKKMAKSFKLKNINSLDEAYNHLINWGNSDVKTKRFRSAKNNDSMFKCEKNYSNISESNTFLENSNDKYVQEDCIDWKIFE